MMTFLYTVGVGVRLVASTYNKHNMIKSNCVTFETYMDTVYSI